MPLHILNRKHGKSAKALILEHLESRFEKRKQRVHEFWILTCYLDLDLIEEVVSDLRETVKLKEVYLAFNFAEVYKKGPSETRKALLALTARLRRLKISFTWRPLACSHLMHSKGYAVIQRRMGEISAGLLLTTSANFTKPGFYGENLELGFLCATGKDTRTFEETYNYLWDNLGCDIDSAILKEDSYLLRYAILASGLFLHKWSGQLSKHTGIKYNLTKLAKEKGAIAPELAAVGFEAGDSFTRQILDLNDLPRKEVPTSFITRFTIETYWGRWCPADAWELLKTTFSGSEEFIYRFRSATNEEELQRIKAEALEIQKNLINQGLIEPVSEDHLDRWYERILELRENDRRLERFFTGYEAHPLPYTAEQRSDVLEIFESLEEAIELSRNTNTAKGKVALALETSDPNLLKMDRSERRTIRNLAK